jgi:hypothetical protein
MRFRIEAHPEGALRILPLIPDISVCHIEGRNGIGKTLAVRLLQLISGEQPYLALKPSWQSLRSYLGRADIKIDKLKGADSIECILDPSQWPDDPDGVGDWLGEFKIDARPARLEDVRKLVQVDRIAGDETLMDAIRLRIEQDAARISVWQRRASQAVVRLDGRLAHLEHDLRIVSPKLLFTSVGERRQLTKQLEALSQELRKQQTRVQLLEEATMYMKALERVRGNLPALKERLTLVRSELQTIRNQRKLLTKTASELQEARDLSRALEAQRRRTAGRNTRHKNALTKAHQEALSLGVEPTEEAIQGEIGDVKNRLHEMEAIRLELDAAPAMIGVADSLLEALDDALEKGLGGRRIASWDDREGLSVQTLMDGVQRESKSVKTLPEKTEVIALDKDIATLKQRIESLERLRISLKRADRSRELMEEAEAELKRLIDAFSKHEYGDYEDLADEMSKLALREQQLTSEVAELNWQVAQMASGRNAEELELSLNHILNEFNVGKADLERETDESVRLIEDLTYQTGEVRRSITNTSTVIEREVVGLKKVIDLLNQPGKYDWLTNLPAKFRVMSGDDRNVMARKIFALQNAVEAARNNISAIDIELDALTGGLRRIADILREERVSVDRRYEAAIVESYEKRFLAEFQQEDFLQALFEGGRVSAVNLRQKAVTWTSKQGLSRTRPLEAFSSGERAFAYTLARLQGLPARRALNRVVALDEFGAYVAKDRLIRLLRFIKSEVLGSIADQVLVLLPLAANYAERTQEAKGHLQNQLALRATSVEEQGYFAEDFGLGA